MAERRTEETCHKRLSYFLIWAPLPNSQEASLEEGPSQLLPAGARARLLSDPALPVLILQGKQLSNHRWGGGGHSMFGKLSLHFLLTQ